MAKITATTMVFLLVLAVAATKPPPPDHSPAPASSDGSDCLSYLADAGDCLSFVVNGSKMHKPDRECCPELTNLTATHPVCLCQLIFNSSQFELDIDTKKAFKLPSICNISTPVSACAGFPVQIPSAAKGPTSNEENGSPSIAFGPSNHHFHIGVLLLYISMNLI